MEAEIWVVKQNTGKFGCARERGRPHAPPTRPRAHPNLAFFFFKENLKFPNNRADSESVPYFAILAIDTIGNFNRNNQITQLDRGFATQVDFIYFWKNDFEARFGIYAKNHAERSRNQPILMQPARVMKFVFKIVFSNLLWHFCT